jgi:hypothetical protein
LFVFSDLGKHAYSHENTQTKTTHVRCPNCSALLSKSNEAATISHLKCCIEDWKVIVTERVKVIEQKKQKQKNKGKNKASEVSEEEESDEEDVDIDEAHGKLTNPRTPPRATFYFPTTRSKREKFKSVCGPCMDIAIEELEAGMLPQPKLPL